MTSPDYKVNIKDVYIGDVRILKPERIKIMENGIYLYKIMNEEEKQKLKQRGQGFLLDNQKNQLKYTEKGGLFQCEETFLRTMLFTLDEQKHANDLLFDSPHYPIFNISPSEDCLSSSIGLTNNVYNLYQFLRFIQYPSDTINYNDVLEIRKNYFNCDFLAKNYELFGVEEKDEVEQDESIVDSNGKLHIIEYKCDWYSLERQLFRMILISKDYFKHDGNIKWERDYQLKGSVVDAFKPADIEGPILNLKP